MKDANVMHCQKWLILKGEKNVISSWKLFFLINKLILKQISSTKYGDEAFYENWLNTNWSVIVALISVSIRLT